MQTFLKKPIVILLLSIIITALWGSATPAIKVGYQLFHIAANDIPTKLLFAGVRFTAAGMLVFLFGLCTHVPMIPKKEDFRYLVPIALLLTAFSYVFFYIGLTYTTGAKGSMFSSTGAFFAVFLSPLFFREDRFSVKKLIGCMIGFAGLYCICMTGENTDPSLDGFHFMGEGFVLINAFIGSLGNMLVKVASKKLNSILITAWQLMIGGVLLLITGLVTGGTLTPDNGTAVALLGYMAFLSAAAFSLQTLLIQYNPVSKILFYNLLIPIFGTALSGIFLQENIFRLNNLLALVLVCLGIGIVNKAK